MKELIANITDIIPLQILLPILVIQLLLLIIALISCIRSEEINGPKWLWVLIIVFINTLGPILYFIFGRKNQ